MVSEAEIGWLAGIMDGEGSMSINPTVRPNGSVRLHPQISITNSNVDIIERAKDIVGRLGIRFGECDHKARKGSVIHSNFDCRRIYFTSAVGMKQLLEALLLQLTGKHKQAVLMLEYLAPRAGRSARVPYVRRDYEIAVEIRNLNRPRLGSVETARDPQLKRAAMIQSDLHGDMQSAAEMSAPVA